MFVGGLVHHCIPSGRFGVYRTMIESPVIIILV